MESYTESSAGFSVNGDKITMDEMDKIKFDENLVIPPASNVKLRIKKAEIRGNGKDGEPVTKKKLNILWQLVNGIEVNGEIKYKNATFFQNGAEFNQFVIWADPTVHTKPYWIEKKYLKPLKDLIKALGLSAFDPDTLETDLVGKEILGTIKQSDITKKNDDGIYVATGDFNNYVEMIKPVVSEASTAVTL